MMTPLTLSVTGYASINQKPDLAILCLEINCTASSRTFVSSELQLSCRRLEELLHRFSTAHSPSNNPSGSSDNPPTTDKPIVKNWIMTNLHSSSSAQPAVPKAAQTVFSTCVSYAIFIAEFNALGTFANQVSLLPYIVIKGVRWTVSNSTQKALRAELRKEAVKDALDRAKDYAKGLALSAVWPVEVREIQWGSSDDEVSEMKKTRGSVSDHASVDLGFGSGEVVLSARVECKFEAE